MKIWAGVAVLFAIGACAAQWPSQGTADDHYDCVNFANQRQAQEFLYPGDPNKLDPDKDGIACQNLQCPCSYSTEGAEGGRSEEGNLLPMRAAERISKSKIAGLVRRSTQLKSWSFSGCQRISTDEVDCRLGAQGESIFRRVACRYAVTMRAMERRLAGRIVDHKCLAVPLPHLTARHAQRVMQAAAETTAGPQAVMPPVQVARVDRLNVAGEVGWLIMPDRATGAEGKVCSLRLYAQLRPKTGEVRVSANLPLCTTQLR